MKNYEVENAENILRANQEEHSTWPNQAALIQSLRVLRESLGFSLNAFGRGIGYTGKQIGRYEKGIAPISDKVIEKIVLAYGVNPDYFKFTVSGEPTVPLEKAVSVPDYEKEKRKIAARIKERRIECGLTQTALAKLCEFTAPNISLIERCEITVTTATAGKLAAALEVGTDWILKGNQSRRNYPVEGKMLEWLWEHEEIRKELWERMKNG